MKTIKKIADEIGVSKQAVYKRLKGKLHTVCAPHVHTDNGVTYISEQGETLIKKDFESTMSAPSEHVQSVNKAHTNRQPDVHGACTEYTQNNDEIIFLREQNKALLQELNQEREHSRQQAVRVTDLAEALADLTRNQQLLLGAEQSRTNPALITGEKEPQAQNEKRGFLGIFKKK